jgi:hypothetical protein
VPITLIALAFIVFAIKIIISAGPFAACAETKRPL